MNDLVKALEAASDHIKLNHKATAWHNDPAAWEIITRVIEPALKKARNEMETPMDDSTKRARVAYEAFRGGLLPMDADVPRWEDAPSWIRDVALVAYLQGKLDAPSRS